MAEAANELSEDLDLILNGLDDTDVDNDSKTSPVVRQSTDSFSVKELIAVLDRISSSIVVSEAKLAATILKNTRGKNNCTALDRFVLVFVEAFNECNDLVKRFKTDSIRAIRLEKEFATLRNDRNSRLFIAWKQLVGDAHGAHVDTSIVVFQHVLQHFWSCVALNAKKEQSLKEQSDSNLVKVTGDEAEREAIRQHAGWAVKRARDIINSGSGIISIKKSKRDDTPTVVTKTCLLSFFKKFGVDQRQNSTGKYFFIVNDAMLEFFIVLHREVDDFVQAGIERDTVVQCLRYLSVSHLVRSEWKKVFGDVVTGEEEAASIIILQRVVSMFVKSKQQIVREQHHLKPQKQSKSLRQTLFNSKKDD